jgi:hypothetical protein
MRAHTKEVVKGLTFAAVCGVLGASLVAGPLAHATTSWDIGFRVTTVQPTNVVVKWRVACTNGDIAVEKRGTVRTQSPITRHLQPSFPDATSCYLTVRAWDVKPYAHPNDPTPPFPVVTTWVRL